MTRLLALFFVAFLLGMCSIGCRTVPTSVPVKEIQDASEAAGAAVTQAKTVADQAGELADDLEELPVPEPVKEKARALVVAAQAAQGSAAVVVEKIEAVAPILETIAGERDHAIAGEQSAKAEARAAWIISGKLIAVLAAIALGIGAWGAWKLKGSFRFRVPP